MITKNELFAMRDMILDIKRERERLQNIRSKLYSPQGFDSREKVQSSGGDKNALIDMVLDTEQQLKNKEQEAEVLKRHALEIFQRLDPEPRQIMTLRFIEAMSWAEVAEIMYYSERTIYRRCDDILGKLFPGEV